ncbi:glutamine-rich protein 2 [Mantella aurantiaca]
MATVVSLSDLINLSIGTPEVGAVNFNALRALLHAVIKHLNIQDVKAEILEEESGPRSPPKDGVKAGDEGHHDWVPNGYHRIEQKIAKLEEQLQALNNLPSGLDLMDREKSQTGGGTPVEDMWNIMQMKKKLESNEDGVNQAMTVLQDLLHEINTLKSSQQELESRLQIVTEHMQQDNDLEQRLALMEMKTVTKQDMDILQIEHQSIQDKLKYIEEMLAKFPRPDELSNVVQWEVLQETLVTHPMTADAQTSYTLLPGQGTTLSKTSLVGKQTSQTTVQEPITSEPMSLPQIKAAQTAQVLKTEGPIEPSAQEPSATAIAQEPRAPGIAQEPRLLAIEQEPRAPGIAQEPRAPGIAQEPRAPAMAQEPRAPAMAQEPRAPAMAQEPRAPAMAQEPRAPAMAQEPKAPVIAQEPSGKTSLSAIGTHEELKVKVEEDTSVPSQAHVASPKLEDKVQAHPGGPTPEHAVSTPPPVSREHAHPAGPPGVGYSSPTTISGDGTQIPGFHPTPAAPLRVVDESKPSSQAPDRSPGAPDKASPPHTPSSSQAGNLSVRFADTVKALRNIGSLSDVHTLLQARVEALERYKADRTELSELQRTTAEHLQNLSGLQEKLGSLYSDLHELKSNTERDRELLQSKVLELQNECELWRFYQHLDLDGSVSRSQFDATTEQINAMMKELLCKLSGQEQDWQKMLEKINLEMQSKLDRMELDPLKDKLEERWREIRRQLQDKPPQYESDEAAGIRRQLFHCLSCDRRVNMMVPGPPILTIPNIPGLPAHRSNRPYIVYELDQIRQYSRSSDRFADFNRRCGGSHTMTFPYRRYVRMQGLSSYSSQDEDLMGIGLKEETDILGSDGQVYHGRMDSSLPAIHTKDGKCKHVKPQGSQRCQVTSDVSVPASRTPSAKSVGSYRKSVLDAQISSLT